MQELCHKSFTCQPTRVCRNCVQWLPPLTGSGRQWGWDTQAAAEAAAGQPSQLGSWHTPHVLHSHAPDATPLELCLLTLTLPFIETSSQCGPAQCALHAHIPTNGVWPSVAECFQPHTTTVRLVHNALMHSNCVATSRTGTLLQYQRAILKRVSWQCAMALPCHRRSKCGKDNSFPGMATVTFQR